MSKETHKNILSTIQYPDDLRRLKLSQLPQLCDELRGFVINELSQNPGHFGSTLGVIELTVALHYVYKDPIREDPISLEELPTTRSCPSFIFAISRNSSAACLV